MTRAFENTLAQQVLICCFTVVDNYSSSYCSWWNVADSQFWQRDFLRLPTSVRTWHLYLIVSSFIFFVFIYPHLSSLLLSFSNLCSFVLLLCLFLSHFLCHGFHSLSLFLSLSLSLQFSFLHFFFLSFCCFTLWFRFLNHTRIWIHFSNTKF